MPSACGAAETSCAPYEEISTICNRHCEKITAHGRSSEFPHDLSDTAAELRRTRRDEISFRVGARSGNSYLSAMRKLKARVCLGGEWIADPITHPSFRRQARLIASLYDLQSANPALMTQRLPDGDRIGWSYAQPTNANEVRKRGLMLRAWAEQSASSRIQTPDAVNLILAALVSAREFFTETGGRFEQNLVDYYSEARRCDWCLATLSDSIDPLKGSPGVPRNRSHLRFAIRADGGVQVDGDAMVTLPGGLFDQVLILPLWNGDEQKSVVCAIPSNAPGLNFDCVVGERSPELIDCRMRCEGVMVPAERVFLHGDSGRCRMMMAETGASALAFYQAIVKSLAQARNAAARADSAEPDAAASSRLIEAIQETEAALGEAEEKASQDRWGQFIPAQASLQRAAQALAQISLGA